MPDCKYDSRIRKKPKAEMKEKKLFILPSEKEGERERERKRILRPRSSIKGRSKLDSIAKGKYFGRVS